MVYFFAKISDSVPQAGYNEPFIVDFYCAKAKLILEIDGSQHYEEQGLAYDAERTAILESFGYKVLRFTNDEVNYNFHSVCDTIDREVQARINAAKQQK